jgi:hypothetical protein
MAVRFWKSIQPKISPSLPDAGINGRRREGKAVGSPTPAGSSKQMAPSPTIEAGESADDGFFLDANIRRVLGSSHADNGRLVGLG